jgi:hypothetical protein
MGFKEWFLQKVITGKDNIELIREFQSILFSCTLAATKRKETMRKRNGLSHSLNRIRQRLQSFTHESV